MKVFDIITEAPVTDIETLNDITGQEKGEFAHSVFTGNKNKDLGNAKLLSRPEWLQKIQHNLRNSRYNFRLYFATLNRGFLPQIINKNVAISKYPVLKKYQTIMKIT